MHTVIRSSPTQRQYQQILDAYGVGQLRSVTPLPAVTLTTDQQTALSAAIVTTSRGTFLLSYAPDNALHELWWHSPSEEAFPLELMDNMKLTHVQPLATRQDLFTVHRFNQRFTLFAL